jgi:Rod binding domain-containing protein
MPIEFQPVSMERGVTVRNMPLDKLAHSSSVSPEDKVKEVSRQFESILLRQILTDAQKPLLNTSLGKSGASGAMYQDLMTSQLADQISGQGGLGLSHVLQAQLGRELGVNHSQTEDAS